MRGTPLNFSNIIRIKYIKIRMHYLILFTQQNLDFFQFGYQGQA